MWHSGVYNNKRTFSLEAALLISWQADGANRFQVQGVKESCGWRGRKKVYLAVAQQVATAR